MLYHSQATPFHSRIHFAAEPHATDVWFSQMSHNLTRGPNATNVWFSQMSHNLTRGPKDPAAGSTEH